MDGFGPGARLPTLDEYWLWEGDELPRRALWALCLVMRLRRMLVCDKDEEVAVMVVGEVKELRVFLME